MKKRSAVLALLVSLSVITYLDRICIAAAGPRMQKELNLSPDQWGWVMGAFILAYGAFEMPSGAMGDRMGQRKVLTRIVIWWSAFTSLTGMASNYFVLLATRFCFGAGEAGAYPNMSGVIARWYHPTERARAQGCIWAASRVGGAITPLLVVPLMVAFGWRSTFVIFGSLGLIWAVIWHGWYRDRSHHEPKGRANLQVCPTNANKFVAPSGGKETMGAVPEASASDKPLAVPWRRLFANPRLWLIMAMFGCYVWGSMFYLTWFHTYLVKGRGLSEAEMGVYAAFPFVLGALGNLGGGWLSDRLTQKFGLSLGRRLVGGVSLALSALLLCATALTTGKASGVVLLTLGFGIMDCMLPCAWAICLDVGKQFAGAATGAMNTAGQAGGFVCSVLFGYLVKEFGNYNAPILVIASMVMISAVLFWFIDATKPLFEAPAEPS